MQNIWINKYNCNCSKKVKMASCDFVRDRCVTGVTYCDTVTKFCTHCSVLCDPYKGLQQSCQLLCPVNVVHVPTVERFKELNLIMDGLDISTCYANGYSNTETTAAPTTLEVEAVLPNVQLDAGSNTHHNTLNIMNTVFTSVSIVLVVTFLCITLIVMYRNKKVCFKRFDKKPRKEECNLNNPLIRERVNNVDDNNETMQMTEIIQVNNVSTNSRTGDTYTDIITEEAGTRPKIRNIKEGEKRNLVKSMNNNLMQNPILSSVKAQKASEKPPVGDNIQYQNENKKHSKYTDTDINDNNCNKKNKDYERKDSKQSYGNLDMNNNTPLPQIKSIATTSLIDAECQTLISMSVETPNPQAAISLKNTYLSNQNDNSEVSGKEEVSLNLENNFEFNDFYSATPKRVENTASTNTLPAPHQHYQELKLSETKNQIPVDEVDMDNNAVRLKTQATQQEITEMGESINVRVYESHDTDTQLDDETPLKTITNTVHATVHSKAIAQPQPTKQLELSIAKPTAAMGQQAFPSKPVARAAGGSHTDIGRPGVTSNNTSGPNIVPAEPQNGSNTSSNKRTYQILRGVDWVEGYFSEGYEIIVYTNLDQISSEVAMKELTVRTGQPAGKFRVESETKM